MERAPKHSSSKADILQKTVAPTAADFIGNGNFNWTKWNGLTPEERQESARLTLDPTSNTKRLEPENSRALPGTPNRTLSLGFAAVGAISVFAPVVTLNHQRLETADVRVSPIAPNLKTEVFQVKNPNKLAQRRALAYDPRFDINDFRQLQAEKASLTEQEYQRRLDQLIDRTRFNLITALGERFNVEISVVSYNLREGKLVNNHHDQPMEEVIKKGVEYRLHHGNPIDRQREAAELEGFQKVQELLKKHQTVVVISPQGKNGSDYRHRFADIYHQENGQIIMSRLIINSDYQQSYESAKALDPNLTAPEQLTDSFFLSHPLVTQKTVEQIMATLNKSGKTMRNGQFQKLIADCEPAIAKYIQDLTANRPETTINDNYNGLLKLADLLTGTDTYTQNHSAKLLQFQHMAGTLGMAAALKSLAAEPIRKVAAACGSQEKIGTSGNNYPWSVSEFGQTEDEWFTCPKCSYKADGPIGSGPCPGCGLTKEQWAEEAGKKEVCD